MCKSEITAKVVADSYHSIEGVKHRITTLQLRYPRFILPELNTHRAFSRNTASSRAIPTVKLLQMVRGDTALPVSFGMNQAGMQAGAELPDEVRRECLALIAELAHHCADTVEKLHQLGLHKQTANRYIEPFMWVDTIVTATEWDNFFKLRLHPDAQPEIRQLAEVMKAALDGSEPELRWYHLPYVSDEESVNYCRENGLVIQAAYDDLAMLSAARCARVSYLNHDQTQPDMEKDRATAERLFNAGHWSPFEHQANSTHDKVCRNFRYWRQFREYLDKGK